MAHLREVKLLAAVYVALAINKKRKVKRKCWVKNWFIYETNTSRPSLHAKYRSKSYNIFSISYFLQIIAVTTVILNTVLFLLLLLLLHRACCQVIQLLHQQLHIYKIYKMYTNHSLPMHYTSCKTNMNTDQ